MTVEETRYYTVRGICKLTDARCSLSDFVTDCRKCNVPIIKTIERLKK